MRPETLHSKALGYRQHCDGFGVVRFGHVRPALHPHRAERWREFKHDCQQRRFPIVALTTHHLAVALLHSLTRHTALQV